MHPRSKQWHLLDYIIVRQRDRQDVRITKAMCGAECWTDHRLMVCKLNLRILPPCRPQGKKPPKRLNISKLKVPQTRDALTTATDSNLSSLPSISSDIESEWAAFRDSVYSAAKDVLGVACRKHKDWFDENNEKIHCLLEEKHKHYKAFLTDQKSVRKKALYVNSRKTVQRELRKMQDEWYSNKADEIQSYADSNNMKDFYASLKSVYGPQPSGSSPLLSADGHSIITDRSKILDRWAEHFQAVLNRPSNVNTEAINRLEQTPINNSLAEPPQSSEIKKAIAKLSSGKAPGQDCIPAEIYASGSPLLVTKLTELFCEMWKQEKLPQELKDASIIHLYKKKGNRQSCDNHRGISLLSIAEKSWLECY